MNNGKHAPGESFFRPNRSIWRSLQAYVGRDIDAETADELGLVTFIPDDIDWEDEVRLALEERASFSPDALTGMEGPACALPAGKRFRPRYSGG